MGYLETPQIETLGHDLCITAIVSFQSDTQTSLIENVSLSNITKEWKTLRGKLRNYMVCAVHSEYITIHMHQQNSLLMIQWTLLFPIWFPSRKT